MAARRQSMEASDDAFELSARTLDLRISGGPLSESFTDDDGDTQLSRSRLGRNNHERERSMRGSLQLAIKEQHLQDSNEVIERQDILLARANSQGSFPRGESENSMGLPEFNLGRMSVLSDGPGDAQEKSVDGAEGPTIDPRLVKMAERKKKANKKHKRSRSSIIREQQMEAFVAGTFAQSPKGEGDAIESVTESASATSPEQSTAFDPNTSQNMSGMSLAEQQRRYVSEMQRLMASQLQAGQVQSPAGVAVQQSGAGVSSPQTLNPAEALAGVGAANAVAMANAAAAMRMYGTRGPVPVRNEPTFGGGTGVFYNAMSGLSQMNAQAALYGMQAGLAANGQPGSPRTRKKQREKERRQILNNHYATLSRFISTDGKRKMEKTVILGETIEFIKATLGANRRLGQENKELKEQVQQLQAALALASGPSLSS